MEFGPLMARHETSLEFLTARDSRLAGSLMRLPVTTTTPTTKTKTDTTKTLAV